MHIEKIISQHRRDLQVQLECEHCEHTYEAAGYDDEFYHRTAVPSLLCPECGKRAGPGFKPLTPKYPEGMTV